MSRVPERATDVIALVAAFMLVVGCTFSDDVVEFLLDVAAHSSSPSQPWLVFVADSVLVLATVALKWSFDDGRTAMATLLRKMRTSEGARLVTDEFAPYRRSTGGISYTDVGRGPVTLFVHGVFTNGRLWRNCVRSLSENRRCISIDLPGHGHTRPVGEASVWGLADAVDTVIDQLNLRDIHLVGNDTGGAFSQIVLTRDPTRFATFALTNCDTEGNLPPAAFRPAVWAAKTGLMRLAAKPLISMPTIAKQIYRTGYQNVSAVPNDVIVDYLTPILGNSDGLRFMTALLSSMTPDQLAPITPLLRTCETPTAIIWGTGDIFFTRKWADWLVDLIPGAKSVTEIPGGRLFFPDERSPELVKALNSHWNGSS